MSAARCSEASLAAGESLSATATTTRSWLLVEVPGGWSRDVGSSDALPDAARSAVTAWLERTDRSRLLFVRRPGRVAAGRLVFVVTGEPGAVRRIEIDSLDDLARVDLDEQGDPIDLPLVLVCGHGSRDQCCALRGTAVYGAIEAELAPEQVWISSHQGGHRFAANVLVLPSGIQLGRVDPESAASVVSSAVSGWIDLEHFRGRALHDGRVQAADVALRRATGMTRTDDLVLVGEEGGLVRFRDRNGREHAARVDEADGPVVPASCGADPERQAAYAVTLV